MSVSASTTVRVIPIYREPGFIPMDRSLMARWHGGIEVIGDGSGGVAQLGFSLAPVVNLFGSHTLWDLQTLSWLDSAFLAAQTKTLQIATGEPTNTETNLIFNFDFTWNDNMRYNLANGRPLFGMKFTFQYQQANFPNIQLTINSQQNLTSYKFFAAGYIYDERLI